MQIIESLQQMTLSNPGYFPESFCPLFALRGFGTFFLTERASITSILVDASVVGPTTKINNTRKST
jgi:hypothetical protein